MIKPLPPGNEYAEFHRAAGKAFGDARPAIEKTKRIRMKKSILLLPVLLICSLQALNAQQQFDSVLRVLDGSYPQEKMYLQYDKSYYNPGETIWFKAYLFSANMPSPISKTFYSELIDEKGKILQRKVSPVVMSSAASSFDLPADLQASVLYVRAYTDWMLNFDSSFLYSKAIPILQTQKQSAKPVIPKTFLHLFPEGGDLINGVESRVAFKATDSKGLPYKVSGQIVDSKGKVVTSFSTAHDGMGFFTITADAKDPCKAVWKDAAGKMEQTPLPTIRNDGIVFMATQSAAGIHFTLSRPDEQVKPNAFVYVVAQMQQQLVYMATANISKSKVINANIPTENIPAGIVQITVFSEDKKPLAERLVFVNKQDYYFITDLNAPLKGFEKRRKNVVQVDVPDTLHTNLSISITDASLNPPQPSEEDIFSTVLLTSDLKGYIHNPAYYFSSDADSVLAHLDLVMMTNGWRRFKWEDALAGVYPKIKYQPADYLTLLGRINGLTKTQLTNQELTGILEIDKKQQLMNIPVTNTGYFSLPGLIFYDTAKLYYQFNNDKEKVLTSRASFDIRNNLAISASPYHADTNALAHYVLPNIDVLQKSSDLAKKNIELQEQLRKTQVLESVTVTAKLKSKTQQMDEEYTSGLFSGGDGYTFITMDDPSASASLTVLNYLQGKVAGLQIAGTGEQMSMSWRGGSPTLFLNEMQSDLSAVQTLPMSDVAMIKVYRPPFLGAPGGGSGGAIAVYTKKGAARNADVKGLDFARIPGYTPPKEFYSPDYSKYDDRQTQPDLRTTLYWNPFLLTDKSSRRMLFTFYNNDLTRRFRVVIEGCNEEGRLTRIEKIFE